MADLTLAPAIAAPAAAKPSPTQTAPADGDRFRIVMAQAAPAEPQASAASAVVPLADGKTDKDAPAVAAPTDEDDDPTADPVLAALLMMSPTPPPAPPETVATGETAAPATSAASPPVVAAAPSADPAQATAQPSSDSQAAAKAVLAMVEAGGAIVDPATSQKAVSPAADAQATATRTAHMIEPPAPTREHQATASAGDAVDRIASKPTRERTRSSDIASIVASADTPRSALATGAAAPAAPSPTDRTLDHAIAGARDGQFLDQIARDIARTGASDSQLSFRLDPSHLGPLSIHIAQGSDGASVRMSSEDAQTRHVLAEAQPRLAAEARAQGLTLRETSVDVGGQRGGSREQAAAWTGRDQPGSQRQPPQSSPDDNAFRVNAGPRPSERPATGSARYA